MKEKWVDGVGGRGKGGETGGREKVNRKGKEEKEIMRQGSEVINQGSILIAHTCPTPHTCPTLTHPFLPHTFITLMSNTCSSHTPVLLSHICPSLTHLYFFLLSHTCSFLIPVILSKHLPFTKNYSFFTHVQLKHLLSPHLVLKFLK